MTPYKPLRQLALLPLFALAGTAAIGSGCATLEESESHIAFNGTKDFDDDVPDLEGCEALDEEGCEAAEDCEPSYEEEVWIEHPSGETGVHVFFVCVPASADPCPDPDHHGVHYIGFGDEEGGICEMIDIYCPDGSSAFSNECGCGCVSDDLCDDEE